MGIGEVDERRPGGAGLFLCQALKHHRNPKVVIWLRADRLAPMGIAKIGKVNEAGEQSAEGFVRSGFHDEANGAECLRQWMGGEREAVTMPKVPPPPPFSAKNRSGSRASLTTRMTPSAVTISASSKLAAAVHRPSKSGRSRHPGLNTSGNISDAFTVIGYCSAQTMVAVLRSSGDNLTRENVMKQAASLHNLALPMLLPGVTLSTSADDFAPIKQMQLMKFDGTAWKLFGELISGSGS